MILPQSPLFRRLALAFLLLAPPLYGLGSLGLGMDANWDLRNYHWYNAYAVLTGRIGFDFLPAQMPSFYSPLLDVPFYWAASALPAPLAGFLLGTVQGVNLSLVFALALAALRSWPEGWRVAWAALLGLMAGLGGGTLGLAGTTFYDNVTSLGVLGAWLLVAVGLPAMRAGGRMGWAGLGWSGAAGLLAGVAMGLKNPAVIYAVGLCAGFLALPLPPVRRLALAFVFGVGVLAGLAAAGGPWMWHLWTEYGNPLFPHMNHIFRSPLAAPEDYRNTAFVLRGWKEALAFPFVMTADPLRVGEVPWFDLRVVVLYLLVPASVLLALAGRRLGWAGRGDVALADPALTRFTLLALAAAYGVWLYLFCIYRYLVTVEMLAPLAIVMTAGLLPLGRRLRVALALALLLLVQGAMTPANWGRMAWTPRWVEAEVPPIADPDHTMVLMGGYWAISHVIPFFPPQIPFVRIQSNFLQPDSVGNGHLAWLQARVAAHRGPFLMLSTIPDTAGAGRAAALMGLRLNPAGCRPIPNNLGEPLALCPVVREQKLE